MGSGDDARKAEVDMLVNASEEKWRRFIVTSFLDLKQNGCAQRCVDKKSKVHPALSMTAVATIVGGAIEALRHLAGTTK